MSPQPRCGGKILVDALSIHGTERIFCVPGESYLEVLDTLVDVPEIAVIVAKHEGAAANMAEAEGKLTGRPGICFVTRGPGATHAANGVHTAFHDSTPMILFIGQVKRSVRGREAFQEVDCPALFRPISKWAAEIDDAARIPELVYRAFQTATSGRPGPVVLSLPEDMLSSECTVGDAPRFSAIHSGPSDGDLSRISQELSTAQRPLLVLGGSGWSQAACQSVRRFAEDNHLPVAASFRRQDLLNNLHPCYAGHLSFGIAPALRALVEESDLVVAVGSRLSDVSTDRYRMLEVAKTRLIHVHPGANELGRVFPPVLGIQAGPEAFAASLDKLEPVKDAPWRERTEKAHADYLAFSTPIGPSAEMAGVDLAAVVGHLSDTLPEESIITSGAGNFAVWVHRFFRYRQLGTELAPTSGSMGYGLPAAIAAKLRFPERTCVCIAGDGCFLMYPQELATAKQFGANVIVLVVNNGMYGTIRMHQEQRFPGRKSATDLWSPDFVSLARSFGAFAEQVNHFDEFAAAFDRAREVNSPALLELRVDPKQLSPSMRLP